jgi:hypothetical protein
MRTLDTTGCRTAFTDALRPPHGYCLEACLGTTYSLEFDAFTAVLLAFAGAELEDASYDPPAVMTSVAGMRDRLRVYVNTGSVHPPRVAHQLFGLYDRVLQPVILNGCAFHPKVWALKFVPFSGPERKHAATVYRVVCASRNATASRCWELGATLEGTLGGRRSAAGAELARFCRQVVRRDRSVPPAIWRLIEELPKVTFDGGREGAEDLRFEWQWPGQRGLSRLLPRHAERAILISPFVRGRFLESLSNRVHDLTVVSTQRELDALPESTHECLERAELFVVSGHGDDEVREMELHAKLLVWESNGERETLVGSANATGSAWGPSGTVNCEAMVALRPGFRVADVVQAFVSPEKGKFHAWIEPYLRNIEALDLEEEAEKEIEQVCRALAALPLVGDYDSDSRTLTLRCTSLDSSILPKHVAADVVPLLQRDVSPWQPYARLPHGLRFANVSLDNLSAFALVRLRDRRFEQIERVFTVQTRLDLDERSWDARDDALNAKLLEHVDARILLLSVLHGLPPGTGVAGGGTGRRGMSGSLLERVSIERVLEACTADPWRVKQIDAVLKASRAVESLATFREFWQTLRPILDRESPRV